MRAMLLALSAACALLLASPRLTTAAAESAGTVSVVVRDEHTKGPLDAVVSLSGASSISDTSDIDGGVVFADVPVGQYTIVVRRKGYEPVRRTFRVEAALNVSIEIEMLPERHAPQEIAIVVVHASHAAPRYDFDSTSAAAQLVPSTLDALRTIPGLNLSDPSRPGDPLSLSVEGHDPSSSRLLFEGVPLTIPGTSFNLSTLDFDLVDGVSVNYADGEAGSLAMRTIEPTTTWQAHGELAYGSFNNSFTKVSAQGTTGKLGIALERVGRTSAPILSGTSFLDASGLDYQHEGDTVSEGTLLNARYSLKSSSLHVTTMESTQHQDMLCSTFTNVVPCGYGPNNAQTGTSHLFSASDDFAVGSGAASIAFNRVTSASMVDLNAQVFDGLPLPESGATSQDLSGMRLHVDQPVGAVTLTLDGSSNAVTIAESSSSFGSPLVPALEQAYHYSDFALAGRFKLRNATALALALGNGGLTGTNGTANASLSVSKANPAGSGGSLSLQAGRGLNADASASLLSSPLALQYNCAAATATGEAPGEPRSENSYASARLAWYRQYGAGEVSVQAYGEQMHNAEIAALLPASALRATMFFPQYFDQVAALYALPTNCGASSPAPQVYFRSALTVPNAVFAGAHADARFRLLRNVVVDANASWTRAAAWSTDPRLTNSLTVFRSGRQLPGVPVLSGFASLAYSPPGSSEYLAGFEYDGYNNARFLPPHVLVDAAFVHHLQRGALSLVVDNLFNVYHGSFASPASAQPLMRADGALIPGVATPYGPTSATLSYAFAVGRDSVIQNDAAKAFAAAPKSDSLVPGLLIEPWPLVPPPNPFLRNTGAGCGGTDRAHADALLDPIKALVDRLQAGENRPAPGPLASIGTTSLTYTAAGTSFALSFTTTKVTTLRAIVYCGLLHVGVQANAEASGLPFPKSPSLTSFTYYYSPSIGFYFIQMPRGQGIAQKFRTYPMPESAPAAPFALQSKLCVPELHATAVRLLGELDAYFDRGAAPADWTIVKHTAERLPWFELRSDDIGTANAMISCAHVAAVKGSELRALGLNGIGPGFNYAPRVGLYILTAP